jgi:plastocyanin
VIKDQKFRPENLKVELGSTVEWLLQCDSKNDEHI